MLWKMDLLQLFLDICFNFDSREAFFRVKFTRYSVYLQECLSGYHGMDEWVDGQITDGQILRWLVILKPIFVMSVMLIFQILKHTLLADSTV